MPTKLGYSIGNLGKSVVWTSFENFMLFYLVSIAGLPPLVAGSLLAATLLWDALFDLAVALWADARGGGDRLGRLIVMGAPMCAIGFWLVFALDRPAAIAAAILLCRIGYSLCDVGHNTLLVRVARTPRDATSVSGYRLIFSACGAALVALASTWSLAPAGAAARQAAFATGALVGGAIYVATLATAWFATRHLGGPAACTNPLPVSRGGRLRALWRHGPFRRTLLVAAVQAGIVPLFLRTLPFFGQAVHQDAGWAGPALATITLGQSLSLPGWMALSRRLPPIVIARIGHAMTIVAMLGLVIASRGIGGTVLLMLLGMALAATNLALWAMLALAAQRPETSGDTNEATPVGLFLTTLKSAAAIGNLVSGTMVALTTSPMTSAPDGPDLMVGVLLLPVVGCLLALYVLRPRGAPAASVP
ncbi:MULTISPECIES: MFS transporter [unclassified Sphingomonas]|uniref:MFS transporter n=1 Tax=unclassified Sphingomonas TaxID=196159 RepID=UPI001F47482C|nr:MULTISPECIES: MFS transporter [unclassified Sphingomonas]